MKFLVLLTLGILSLSKAEESYVFTEFLMGYDQFSAALYKELVKNNSGNFLVSPLSLDTVLALATGGARGQTAKELTETLGLPDNSEIVNDIFITLAPHLQSNYDYELNSANKVYIKEGFEISDIFKSTTLNVFKTEVDNIDFERNVEAAEEINKWVDDKTLERIRYLIQPGYLDEHTRALLVNAIYFHGNWTHPFDKDVTQKRPFYLNDNDNVDTYMMEALNDFNYYESSELNARFLELPYAGGDVSMHIVLPKEKHALNVLEIRIEDVLTPPSYSYEKVHVSIPKFKIESLIGFKPILENMGIELAFQDEADFSGIGARQQNLSISEVLQKTFIEVEETGAAVATANSVVVLEPSAIEEPKTFYADHPFMFYIRLNKLGINLFVGTFKFPRK